jgi:UDP-sugar diphosphatase
MIEIEDITEDFNPKFVKPKLLKFKENGKKRSWEVLDVYDSVAILLYHEEKDAFILVKQFRPAVYMKNKDGYTYELCAGLVDKEKSLTQIAKEEILEECGYDVPLENIQEITEFYTSVGFAGGKQTMFFCKVNESQKVSNGGGIEDENIEVLYLPIKEAKKFMYDKSKVKTPGLLFSFLWFFQSKS